MVYMVLTPKPSQDWGRPQGLPAQLECRKLCILARASIGLGTPRYQFVGNLGRLREAKKRLFLPPKAPHERVFGFVAQEGFLVPFGSLMKGRLAGWPNSLLLLLVGWAIQAIPGADIISYFF